MLKQILYVIVQCTWGLPQTIAGLCVFLLCRLKGVSCCLYHGGICTHWQRGGGVSLGLFFFCEPGDRITAHEYGHTIQSLILGPLYLFVIGLPSALWCNLKICREYRRKTGRPYSWLYCEKWADILGDVFAERNVKK